MKKIGMALVLVLSLMCMAGCQGNGSAADQSGGQSADQTGEQSADQTSDTSELPSYGDTNPLKEWYEEQKLVDNDNGRVTYGVRENVFESVSYKAVNDSAQITGYYGDQVVYVQDTSMKEEDFDKMAQFFFFNELDLHEDVVEWTAEFKGKAKYKVFLRFADRERTSVALYKISKGKPESKPYAVIDYKDQIKKMMADGDVRRCIALGEQEIETHLHPQLNKKVTGTVESITVVFFSKMTKEQQQRIAAAEAQRFVDKRIKGDEENEKIFLGIRVGISCFGEKQEPELFFMWDKNKDKLLRAETEK